MPTREEIETIINEALRNSQDVWVEYEDRSGRVSTRTITPIRWESDTKIRAYCHRRQAERTFVLGGIKVIEPVAPLGVSEVDAARKVLHQPQADFKTAYPTIREVSSGASLSGSPLGEIFTWVSDTDQWSRLMQYYAACLTHEFRQHAVVEGEGDEYRFFPLEPPDVRRFLAGQVSLEFPIESKGYEVPGFTRNPPHEDAELCVGYPMLLGGGSLLAPLIIAPVTCETATDRVTLTVKPFAISYAALKQIQLDVDECQAILQTCHNVYSGTEEATLRTIEKYLVNRIEQHLGQPLIRDKVGDFTLHAVDDRGYVLYESPCLFWTGENRSTRNLIQELHALSQVEWDDVPQILRMLLVGVPQHEYSPLPPLSRDRSVYVTPVTDKQRQAVHAARDGVITVVAESAGMVQSHLVLNLIADTVIHNRRVLFASRNNLAIDAVMKQLRDVLGFQGCVRVGGQAHRRDAAIVMQETLSWLISQDEVPDKAALYDHYYSLRTQLQLIEEQLSFVRQRIALLEADQVILDSQRDLLPWHIASHAEQHAPVYRRDEAERLTARLSTLGQSANQLEDRRVEIAETVRQHIREAVSEYPLMEDMQVLESPESLQTYVGMWLTLLSASHLQYELADLRWQQQQLSSSLDAKRGRLPLRYHDKTQTILSRMDEASLTKHLVHVQKLSDYAIAVRDDKLRVWERLLSTIRLRSPPRAIYRRLSRIESGLGLPPSAKGYDTITLVAICRELVSLLEVCLLQHQLDETNTKYESRRVELEDALNRLPPGTGDELSRHPISTAKAGTMERFLKAHQKHIADLQAQRDQLIERINHIILENTDSLVMLKEFREKSGGRLAALWQVPEQASPGEIGEYIWHWLHILSLWEVSARVAVLRREIGEQPDVNELVNRSRKLQDDLDHTGASILNSVWLERTKKGLDARIIRDALDYASASHELSEGYDRRTYRYLRSAVENNMPGAMQVFPIWATTNLAVKTNFPLKAGLFDLIIVDEASQSDIASTLPLLYRSNNVVIIGDPRLPPSHVTLAPATDHELAASFGISLETYSYRDHSLFDIAQRSTGTQPGQIVLEEHLIENFTD